MKVLVTCWVFLAMVVLSIPAHALEPLVFYDDFEADLIDPTRWFGVDFGIGIREAVREIRGNRLRVAARSYGLTDTNTGRLRSGNQVRFLNPADVTAIQATVRVKEFEATGCGANPTPTLAIARLQGDFFNTGIPIAGSAVNDVFASIDIRRASNSTDPPDVLRVFSFVRHCANAECLPLLVVPDPSVLHNNDLGTVEQGEQVELRIQWDPDNNRFIFQRDGGPEVFFSYTVSDEAPPGRPVQGLDITHFVANCTAVPRPMAFMKALFDDVFVNESAAP